MYKSIGVIGAGSWGTTLADLLAKKRHRVTLWAYEKELVEEMQTRRENSIYLPGIKLAGNLNFTGSLKEAVSGKDLLLFVVPTQVLRRILVDITAHIPQGAIIVSASKGIEVGTLKLVSGGFIQKICRSVRSQFCQRGRHGDAYCRCCCSIGSTDCERGSGHLQLPFFQGIYQQ